MRKSLQLLTILGISLVVMLLTMSLSARGLIQHNISKIFSTAQASENVESGDENVESGDDHVESGDENGESGDENGESGDENGNSGGSTPDNGTSYQHQTPKVQQY